MGYDGLQYWVPMMGADGENSLAGPCWRISMADSRNRKENNLKNYSATLVNIYIYVIYVIYQNT